VKKKVSYMTGILGVNSCAALKRLAYLDFDFVDIELEKSGGILADEHVHGLFELSHSVPRVHGYIWEDVQVHSGRRGKVAGRC
jgi:hypothetical protein